MRVKFLGAAQEVTGSLLVLETPGGRLVVDCGLYQGRRSEARQRNRELPAEAIAADAVLLTHAHVDHSGSLPTLVKLGYRGSIYATPATRDLCAYMLRDIAYEAGEKQVMIVIVDRVASQSGAARRIWSRRRERETRCGQALVCGTMLARAIGSFFLGLNRAPFPTRMFATLEQALAWAERTVTEHGGKLEP